MKGKSIKRRIVAALMVAVMCCSLFPVSAYADEMPYGISSVDGNITEVKALTNEDITAISEEAERLNYGIKGLSVFGECLSPFYLKSSDSLVEFKINMPELSSAGQIVAEFMGYTFKIAVQDASDPNAPVLFYPVTFTDKNSPLTVKIPVSSSGVKCALVQNPKNWIEEDETYVDYNLVESETVTVPEKLIEDVQENQFAYQWEFSLGESDRALKSRLSGEVKLKLPDQLSLKEDSVKISSEFFDETYDIKKQVDNTWLITLKVRDGFEVGMYDSYKPEATDAYKKTVTISYEATLNSDGFIDGAALTPSANITLWNHQPGTDAVIFIASDSAEFKTTKLTPAVNITPADMTIYEGGNGGYEGVVGADGEVIKDQTSLPHPLFYIEGSPVAGLENLDSVQFTANQGEDGIKTWTVVRDGTDKGGKALYHFVEVDGTEPVRVTYSYYDEDQQKTVTVMGDEFDAQAIGDSYRELDINIYEGANEEDFSNVTATIGDKTGVALNVHSGTLTVRAVDAEEPAKVVTPIAASTNAEGFTAPTTGQAVAVVPEGQTTTYTLNYTEVQLPDNAAPSLLFDTIIDEIPNDTTTTRTALLQAAVYTKLGGAVDGRKYDIKYLDLVDANNGNAWITSSAGVDVYWGYPDGTDLDTEFKLIHFPGLHRDGLASGFDPDDLTSMTEEDMEEVKIISQDANGIKFHVGAGGFSPFALVWDPAEDPGPGPDPDPDPNPPIHPVDPTPELERGDHFAYIVGYEDDTIRPQNNITRAEVATIFFRLLTDESREAYFTTDCDFTDVAGGAWYANTVATLSNAGILAGYPDGSFRPNDPITRAEFAAIATRFDDLAAAESTFTDIDGHWAEDAINAAYGAGWVGGYPDGTFRPNNNITRAEVMSLVNRVLDREVDEDGMLDDMLTWIDNEPGTWYYEAVQEATNSHDYERKDADSLETWTKINDPIDWDKIEAELLN